MRISMVMARVISLLIIAIGFFGADACAEEALKKSTDADLNNFQSFRFEPYAGFMAGSTGQLNRYRHSGPAWGARMTFEDSRLFAGVEYLGGYSSEKTDSYAGQPHTNATLTFIGPTVGYRFPVGLRLSANFFFYVEARSNYGGNLLHFHGYGYKGAVAFPISFLVLNLEYFYVYLPEYVLANNVRGSNYPFGMDAAFMADVGIPLKF